MEYVKGFNREQIILFPEAIDDYIAEDNQIKFIEAFVENLNIEKLGFKYANLKHTGRPPYDPADMLKLYIYGYLNRIRSSRRLETETKRNVELMWLLKKLSPDFKTIADFRKNNPVPIKSATKEFTLLCKRLDLFGGELIAIDGSKFRAQNSKKAHFTQAKLKQSLKAIDEKVEQYLRELEENDAKEVSVKATDKDELNAKIDSLKKRKDKYQGLLKKMKSANAREISLTDPDARAMLTSQKIQVSYNIQTTVDEKYKLILDNEVTNEAFDHHHLAKMAKRAKAILGVDTLEVLADRGYYDSLQIKACLDSDITTNIPRLIKKRPGVSKGYFKQDFLYDKEKDIYTCPEGQELTYMRELVQKGKVLRRYTSLKCRSCQALTKCTTNKRGRSIYRWQHENILEEMQARIAANKEKINLRSCLSEHPFGTIKRSFNQGYMLLRGLEKVKAEISLSVLAYNIKRAINIVGIDVLISATS